MTVETSAWLALIRAPGLKAAQTQALLEEYGEPQAMLAAAARGAAGIAGATRDWCRSPDQAAIDNDLAWLAGKDRHLISLTDARYPALLRDIPRPPLALFVAGDPDWLAAPQLAMVGSRNPTPAGEQNAREFARALASAGLTLTSGLATGIDAAAHDGALQGGGGTIAVLGTGPDRIYPARNRELAHRIVAQGALVTEFAPGTGARKEHFPQRNRIISGLSLGTLVVEAAQQSGSLITARYAVEQGREVFAIPGSIHNPLARGAHRLIRDGAKLVETAADVLEEIGPRLNLEGIRIDQLTSAGTASSAEPAQDDAERTALLNAMGYEATPVDTLIKRSGLTPESVSSMLLILELEGRVARSPGGSYIQLSSAGV